MNDMKRFSLVKPTTDTPFHIDFDWWKQHDNNWKVYLRTCLCQEHQDTYTSIDTDTQIDWIDPETGEVQLVDGLQHILINHCARQDSFITGYTTLVDAVFRILVSNGNIPMTVVEISKHTGRPPETILRTLTGTVVYKGIRPCTL
jgi:hypothetical protein